MDSTNEGHAPMKKGSQLAPFALPLTAYLFVGWFKSDSSREALKRATREERGLPEGRVFLWWLTLAGIHHAARLRSIGARAYSRKVCSTAA